MNVGFLYAIGAAVTWGLVYALDQKILSTMQPLALLFVDSVLTALLLLPFFFMKASPIKEVLATGKGQWGYILLSMALAALANFLIFSGIKSLDASTASIIEIAYPFFVILFSFILFRSTPNIYFLLGGILVFLGSVIIIKFS